MTLMTGAELSASEQTTLQRNAKDHLWTHFARE
jgi:hypothetical protein